MSRRLVRVTLALALLLAAAPEGRPAESSYRVTCRVPGDPAERVFVLEPAAGHWQLAFRSREITRAPVRLALPGARPEVTATAARLAYRNANGGRQVDLAVGDGQPARLDVWVDHGLEVNIEPDLDPRVDLMSTHGPLEGVQCTIEPAAGR